MQLIDLTVPLDWLTVPLDWNLPVSPGHTRLSFTRITRMAKGGCSNVSTLPPPLRGAANVRGGSTLSFAGCRPLRFVGADGPAPRIVLRKS
jgi:kynurenine formamidase